MRCWLRTAAVVLVILLASAEAALPMSLEGITASPATATGLVAGQRFECWVRFTIRDDLRRKISMHPGDRLEIAFPRAFKPVSGRLEASFLTGYRADDASEYRLRWNSAARTLTLITRGSYEQIGPVGPGDKALHVIAPVRNPPPGLYHVTVRMTIAGRRIVGSEPVRIGATPVASIAPFGRVVHRQVPVGAFAAEPLDFLITDVDGSHPIDLTTRSLESMPGMIDVMRGSRPIGRLVADRGARLVIEASPGAGIVRTRVAAPPNRGRFHVTATLHGGTTSVVTLIAQ